MKGLKSTAQTRYDLRYHFVFVPRYRKRVLKGKIANRLAGLIKFCCQIHSWEIYELAVEKDHVHLYLGIQPKYSPSQVMKRIKGSTSNKLRKLYPNLDEIYWGATFWADGFFVKSVGNITNKVISNYIKRRSERWERYRGLLALGDSFNIWIYLNLNRHKFAKIKKNMLEK